MEARQLAAVAHLMAAAVALTVVVVVAAALTVVVAALQAVVAALQAVVAALQAVVAALFVAEEAAQASLCVVEQEVKEEPWNLSILAVVFLGSLAVTTSHL
jgi:hypothetical protein